MTESIRPHLIVDQITTAADKIFELAERIAAALVQTTLQIDDCRQQNLFAKSSHAKSYGPFQVIFAPEELLVRKFIFRRGDVLSS